MTETNLPRSRNLRKAGVVGADDSRKDLVGLADEVGETGERGEVLQGL